jgi:hypothetical protein
MKELFELSHFFEFLCGAYFGGGALLGFIEETLISRIKSPIDNRVLDIEKIRLSASDFSKFFMNKKVKDLKATDYVALVASILFKFGDHIFKNSFKSVTSFISKLHSKPKEPRSNVLLKRYFPAFFYTGFYCLIIVLLSALQVGNKNLHWSHRIDWFFINFSVGSFLFQIWSLLVIPRWVGRHNYLRILAFGIFISLSILIGTIITASLSYIIINGDLFLAEEHKSLCQTVIVFISTVPLIFLMILTIWVLIRWELITLFYNVAHYLFVIRVKNNLELQIDEIKK